MPEVSIVVPMHNEAAVLDGLLSRLSGVLARVAPDFEIVCVDDGSRDDTWSRLEAHASADARIKPLQLSRNFGKEAALMAGLEAAQGRAIGFMDADLQHPPELLEGMLVCWREGADVVSAVKRTRGQEPAAYRVSAWLFNKLSRAALGRPLEGASDFKLLDRQVADAILDCPERNRFFRGIVAWVGFRVVELPFDVAPRAAGSSQFALSALFRFAVSALLAFTAFPLQLVASVGVVALGLSLLLALQTLYRYVSGTALGGFTTVILLQLILNGFLLAGIGVIALYVAEIYAEVKARPLFVVRKPRAAAAPRSHRE